MGFGFPKSARLLRRHEFERVLRQGQRVFTRHFIVYVHAGETDRARIGITVSRKVGGAVVRNRVRRVVREAFRTHPRWFRSPVDLVVIAKQARADASAEDRPEVLTAGQVAEEIGHALQRAQRGSRPPGDPRPQP